MYAVIFYVKNAKVPFGTIDVASLGYRLGGYNKRFIKKVAVLVLRYIARLHGSRACA